MTEGLSDPAKLFLLSSLLAKDGVISMNGRAVLKELILDEDKELYEVLDSFEKSGEEDDRLIQRLHQLVDERGGLYMKYLFAKCSTDDAKILSKAERQEKNIDHEKSLIYGEIEFGPFARILRLINPEKGSTFVDLGSGTGRAVFAVRILPKMHVY